MIGEDMNKLSQKEFLNIHKRLGNKSSLKYKIKNYYFLKMALMINKYINKKDLDDVEKEILRVLLMDIINLDKKEYEEITKRLDESRKQRLKENKKEMKGFLKSIRR